jgi:hypothetical protein
VSFLFTFSLLSLSAFLTFCFGPKSLSYNSLSSSLLIFSFCFGYIAFNSNNIKYKHTLTFISGFFLAFCFFIKPSSAIVYGFFCLLFIAYEFIYQKQKNWFSFVLYTLGGWGFGNCLYFIAVESPFEFYNSFVASYSHVTSLSKDYGVNAFNKGIFKLCDEIFSMVGFLSIVLIVHYYSLQLKSKKHQILCNSTLIFISLLFYYNSFVANENDASPFLFLALFVLLYFLFQVITLNIKIEVKYSLVIMLFLLPFIGAFGTNNALVSNAMFMIMVWAALAIYLVYTVEFPFHLKKVLLYTFLVTSVVVFYNYFFKFPYRANSLNKQTELHTKSNIYLNKKLSESILAIDDILRSNNFKDGDPIIGMYKIPGLIYLLGGTSPGDHQSIWDHRHVDFYLNNLKRSNQDYSKSYLLIKNNITSAQIKKMNEVGINYPDEFVKIGSVFLYNFYKTYSGNCMIYAHKTKISKIETLQNLKN